MQKLHLSRYNLLYILLIASPALLALCYMVMIVTLHWPSGFGMELLVLALVYPLASTFILYRYQISSGTLNTNRIFVWALIRGMTFGIAFFFLFFLPVGLMELALVYHNILYLGVIERWFLNATVFGIVFGGAAGSVLGLFMPRRQAALSP